MPTLKPDAPPYQSNFRAYMLAPQDVPASTSDVIIFNAKWFDGKGEYDDTTTYRFTAKKAGEYLVMASAEFRGTVANVPIALDIYLNTDFELSHQTAYMDTSVDDTVSISGLVSMEAGDYLEARLSNGGGTGTVTIVDSSDITFFAEHRLS